MKRKSPKIIPEVKFIEFLNLGSFPGHVLFSVGFSYEELLIQIEKNYTSKKWVAKDGCQEWLLGIKGDDHLKKGSYWAASRTLEHPEFGVRDLYYIILAKPFDFSDNHMCILAHECLHICQYYLPDVLDRNKEHEAEAYLHTHLMRQCLEYLRNNKSNKK